MSLSILIINKNNTIYNNNKIKFIKVNNFNCNFEIYKKHIPLILYLKKCNLYIYEKKIYNFYVYKGFLECIYDKITVIDSFKKILIK